MPRAHAVLRLLASVGVDTVCLCPGGRCAPLVAALEAAGSFKVLSFFDERSAGFFALGRARAGGRPVAVITTSGTAVAELLPCAIEAHYTMTPLLFLSADRPRRLRGTGAPQTIDQVGLFGPHAQSVDIGEDQDPWIPDWRGGGALHLNVCFEEPLLDGPGLAVPILPAAAPEPRALNDQEVEGHAWQIDMFLRGLRRPLVVVGALLPADRLAVRAFLEQAGLPCLLEAPSGLREEPSLAHLALRSGAGLLRFQPDTVPAFDGVLRMGGMPTLRLWRDLAGPLSDMPVLSVSHLPYSGLPSGGLVCTDLALVLPRVRTGPPPEGYTRRLLEEDRNRAGTLQRLLAEYPRSEPSLLHGLSMSIPAEADIYIGNSGPIRDWDLAAAHEYPRAVGCSRGANGIDGQLSTFLGWASAPAGSWAIVGDLTALYDLSAPWIISQLAQTDCHIVVINNGGGQIFSRLFESPLFRNHHKLGFAPLAELWGLSYDRWAELPDGPMAGPPTLIELVPDTQETTAIRAAISALHQHPMAME